MRVADSSYITEGVQKRKGLFDEDFLLTPDLAVYEVLNSIWKHQCLLKDLKDGKPFATALIDLVESGKVRLVRPWKELVEEAYEVARRARRPVYDTVFVVLARGLGLPLATFDKKQLDLLRKVSKL